MGWIIGFEPMVFGATNRRFNQLSYTHHISLVVNPTALILYHSVFCLSRVFLKFFEIFFKFTIFKAAVQLNDIHYITEFLSCQQFFLNFLFKKISGISPFFDFEKDSLRTKLFCLCTYYCQALPNILKFQVHRYL